MHDKHAPARLATLEPRLPAGGMVGQKKDDLLTQTELTQRGEPKPTVCVFWGVACLIDRVCAVREYHMPGRSRALLLALSISWVWMWGAVPREVGGENMSVVPEAPTTTTAASSEDPVTTTTADCSLSPSAYWALRNDAGWPKYVGSNSEPASDAVVLSETEGDDGRVTRVTKLTTLKNPIPWTLRGALGCRDGFAFTITETWHRDKWDSEHPMEFVTKPPVMADRIHVFGSQWVEPLEDGSLGSRLHFRLSVQCKVRGVGSVMAKGIADGSLAAYKQTPRLALEYTMLRHAADRASRMSEGATESEPPTPGISRAESALPDEPSAPTTVPAADMLRVRVRMRWRMALMGVRFQRAFQMQQNDDYRLCDARVDAPRTEGFGPKRHTTYQISSRIRARDQQAAAPDDIDGEWHVSRHRFSDFVRLRAQLLRFLPGLPLPELPEKKVPNRFAADVVEGRRAILQTFLQHVLDHPILATCDDLAAFLAWSDAAREPVFARAQTCYDTPASSQRRAHERLWSLRQERRRSSDAGAAALGGRPSPSLAGDAEGGVTAGSRRLSGDNGAAATAAAAAAASTEPAASLSRRSTAEQLSRHWSSSTYDTATSSRSISRLNSYAGHGGGGVLAEERAVERLGASSAAHRPTFPDALAAAVLQTANDAAAVLQRAQSSRSNRSSRLTEEDEGSSSSASAAPPNSSPVAAPAKLMISHRRF